MVRSHRRKTKPTRNGETHDRIVDELDGNAKRSTPVADRPHRASVHIGTHRLRQKLSVWKKIFRSPKKSPRLINIVPNIWIYINCVKRYCGGYTFFFMFSYSNRVIFKFRPLDFLDFSEHHIQIFIVITIFDDINIFIRFLLEH